MSSGIEKAIEQERADRERRMASIHCGQPDTPHSGHYRDSKIQPWDVVDDWQLGYYAGNVLKYIKRLGKKDGESPVKDAEKIVAYAQKLLAVVREEAAQ